MCSKVPLGTGPDSHHQPMTRARSAPGTRRLTLTLPTDLVDWLQGFAEISHQTVEDVLRPLIEAERARHPWDGPSAEPARRRPGAE